MPFNSTSLEKFTCSRADMRGEKDLLRPVMLPDLEKYRPYLDGYDMTEAQKDEFIHTLWTIMEAFADRAFGLHPAQQIPAFLADGDSNGEGEAVDLIPLPSKTDLSKAACEDRRRKDLNDEGDKHTKH